MAAIILILAVCVLIFVGIMFIFWKPELISGLMKSIAKAIRGNKAAEDEKNKPKKITPSMALAIKIEQLPQGQTLRYRISPEAWGADYLTIELNQQYPQKGKKFVLSTERNGHGKELRKSVLFDSDEAIEIANSVLQRDGEAVPTG